MIRCTLRYSFGSCIAAHGVQHSKVRAYCGIGPPAGARFLAFVYSCCIINDCTAALSMTVSNAGWLANAGLRTRRHLDRLKQAAIPKLVIQGTRDEFTAVSSIESLAIEHNAAIGCSMSKIELDSGDIFWECQEGLSLLVCKDCDHFWLGAQQSVARAVLQWVENRAAVAT